MNLLGPLTPTHTQPESLAHSLSPSLTLPHHLTPPSPTHPSLTHSSGLAQPLDASQDRGLLRPQSGGPRGKTGVQGHHPAGRGGERRCVTATWLCVWHGVVWCAVLSCGVVCNASCAHLSAHQPLQAARTTALTWSKASGASCGSQTSRILSTYSYRAEATPPSI